MNVKIIIATHKPYWMPSDPCYLPLHVGKKGKPDIGFTGDDTGDHISEKNPYYCELTGLYWAWKNLDADYLGLAHYRRHYSLKPPVAQKKDGKQACVLSQSEVEGLLKEKDIILPKRRGYVIETIYTHYIHTHYQEPLDVTRRILLETHPDMLPSFDKIMKRRGAHMFNMYIMERKKSDDYCSFLFPVLFELEKRVDISSYNAFQARVFGRISEMLLDVWIDYKGYDYTEVPFMFMEKTNWFVKVTKFLRSKYLHEMY